MATSASFPSSSSTFSSAFPHLPSLPFPHKRPDSPPLNVNSSSRNLSASSLGANASFLDPPYTNNPSEIPATLNSSKSSYPSFTKTDYASLLKSLPRNTRVFEPHHFDIPRDGWLKSIPDLVKNEGLKYWSNYLVGFFLDGDNWYMHKSVILDIVDERSVIIGNSGYWEFISNIGISMPGSTHTTIGRKITRKFLLDNGTCVDKTTFGMHEYLVEQEKNKFKETRLSRIFSQIDEVKNEEESVIGGENSESKLPFMVNQLERDSSLNQYENEYQGSNEIEGLLELPNDIMNEEAGLEDFIELKDLFDPEDGNSSFSANTSVKSMTSDENFESEIMGFDAEGMISQIANDVNNVNASVSSDPAPVVAGVMGKNKSEVSTSSSSESDGGSTSAKHSENGASYKRVKSRSARRMAKLGKRYCCFS